MDIVPVITGTLSHRAGYPATDRGLEVSEVELADVRGVEVKGGPSRIVLSAPTVNEPSLPAVNDWPCCR